MVAGVTTNDTDMEKKAIIVGASSGIGYDVAQRMIRDGWTLGLAARRTDRLAELAAGHPGRVRYVAIDVTGEDAGRRLRALADEMGGMDLYLHVAGVGWQNHGLEEEKELRTVETNALGFARMVGEAYRYFAERGAGHIAAVSSIAGTKGLGPAPAYSATKAFDSNYMQALEQQAHARGLRIRFTDIRPGFVRTPLLDDGRKYPMLMAPGKVADDIVRSITLRRHVRVTDWRYRILTALWRCIPACLWRQLRLGVRKSDKK